MAKKKKKQGHFCKVCGEHKVNEKFSGKGHAAHICKACAKLPASERSEMETLRRIDGMAFRYINDGDIKWLRKRMKDSREEVREAAVAVNQLKFPNYGKQTPKTAVKHIELHINDTVWDEWGDEVDVHANVSINSDGLVRLVNHAILGGDGKSETKIGVKCAKQLFQDAIRIRDDVDSAVAYDDYDEEYDALFDPEDIEGLDEWIVRDIMEIEQAQHMEAESSQRESPNPLATMAITFKGGEVRKLEFPETPDSMVELYWDIASWFEPDDEDDYYEEE